jgi:hypothetical protein
MIDSRGLFNSLTTFAATSGMFDSVTGHEPVSAPAPTGVSCSVWFSEMQTVPSSGLVSASVRIEFYMRIFTSVHQGPEDGIDPRVMDAADSLFTSLAGGFTLAGAARYVDILGADGAPLRAVSGYVKQDGAEFRTVDVIVPIVINDVYSEAP